MDRKNSLAARADFWAGVFVGTLGGMAIAAYTYSIAHSAPRKQKELLPSNAKVAVLELSGLGSKLGSKARI